MLSLVLFLFLYKTCNDRQQGYLLKLASDMGTTSSPDHIAVYFLVGMRPGGKCPEGKCLGVILEVSVLRGACWGGGGEVLSASYIWVMNWDGLAR